MSALGGFLASAGAALALAGCAAAPTMVELQEVHGISAQTLQARLGEPTDKVRLHDGRTRWLYSGQPLGLFVYAADFDANGALIDYRQMLTMAELQQAKPGEWSKQDVEARFGKPRLPIQYYALQGREVWSYRFQYVTQAAVFHFQFDSGGVLRGTQMSSNDYDDMM
ncbi:conserved exported hypothetical protein [Cupriavidus necator]|uniref:Lipoprotein n=1 Tax=Cupriavidus necator TaxID=106590 RepID=A0A1K0IL48_CUPNE|nr:conserved exported hypothetical protein [Cupriavidus necator]